MKLIIDIPEKVVTAIQNGGDYRYDILTTIAQGIPYEESSIDEWIPVSERLPDERDWYLGLFKEPDTGFIGIPYICDHVGEITKGTTKEGWILRHCTDVDNPSDYFRNLICVAWRPLPEPYKVGGEKE